jgi:hypothetical protein
MTTKIEPTELDLELIQKAELKKIEITGDMITYREIFLQNETNDYPFFLYIASILNFAEYHNGGVLTEWGMKSLQLDISPYLKQLQTGEPKLGQKDLIRLLLNLLNSYATSVLVKGLIEFSKEDPESFFSLNDYLPVVRGDFEKLSEKLDVLIPKLKQVLDVYSPMLDGKYKKIFLEEKTKGFYKQIFDPNALKITTNKFPSDLANAKECK